MIVGGGGEAQDTGRTDTPKPKPKPRRRRKRSKAANPAKAVAAAEAAKRETPVAEGWTKVLQVVAVAAGISLLIVGASQWTDAPPVQIGKATIDGQEAVATKTTTTKATADKPETVVEEPAIAVAGRSETIVLGMLILGTVLIVAAALPGRRLTLKGPGFEAALDAVGTAARKETEEDAKEKGLSDDEVKEAGNIADRDAKVRMALNLEEMDQGGVTRLAGDLSRGRMGTRTADVLAEAAEQTIEEAREAAIRRVAPETVDR